MINKIQITGTIRLGQFLKLTNIAENGHDAKNIIAQGKVTVNNETALQRGMQLKNKDIISVKINGEKITTQIEQIQ